MKFKLLTLCMCASILSYGERFAPDNLASYFDVSLNNTASGTGKTIGVDKYTGTLQTGFELYSYSNRTLGLTHSISLSYQGGGIKVDDIATNVGLGWNIDIGGTLVRMINGLPDESNNGFWSVSALTTADTGRFRDITDDIEDSQYDEFFFSAGNYSGKFIIGKNDEIVQIPRSNLQIERLYDGNDPLLGFIITTPEGVKYEYLTPNLSTADYGNKSWSGHTAWNLTDIKSSFNESTIYFNYTTRNISYLACLLKLDFYGDLDVFPPGSTPTPYIINWKNKNINNVCVDNVISSIEYPNNVLVEFTYDNFVRLDLRTDYALKNISLSSGSVSFSYNFDYAYVDRENKSYLTYQDYSGNSTIFNKSENKFSLQLNGFNRISGANSIPGYKFEYDPIILPGRGIDNSVDHWGYYSSSAGDKIIAQGSLTGGTRATNANEAFANSLKKVWLPTGGSIAFEYELHSTPSNASIGGARVKKVTSFDGINSTNNIITEYKYVDASGVSSGVSVNMPEYSMEYYEVYNPSQVNASMPYYVTDPVAATLYQGKNLVTAFVDPNHIPFAAYVYTIRASEAINSVVYTHGNFVGYSRVEEYIGGVASFKTKTVYEYTTNNDYPLPTAYNKNSFPYIPRQSFDFATGLLKVISKYNSSNQLLEKTENLYTLYPEYLETSDFTGLKVGNIRFPVESESNYRWDNYYPVTGKILLVSTTETEYYSGGKSVSKTKTNTFDLANNVLKSVKTTDALNNDITTKYYYPFDYNITGSINGLTAKGLKYTPIVTETYKYTTNPVVLNASVVSFQTLTDNSIRPVAEYGLDILSPITYNTIFTPSQLLRYPSSQSVKSNFDYYDAKGNLTQGKAQNMPFASVWSTEKEYQTATIANALKVDVAYTSFEDVNENNSGWTFNGSPQTPSSGSAVTGEKNFSIYTNSISKVILSNQVYTLSFWANTTPPVITITTAAGSNTTVTPVAMDIHNGWQLYSTTISNATFVSLASPTIPVRIDELRLYPAGTLMNTQTVNPLVGVTSKCNGSNYVTRYEYDECGRPKYERDNNNNIIKAYDFQMQQPQ